MRVTGIHKKRLVRHLEERLPRIQLEIRQKAETHRTLAMQAIQGTGPIDNSGQPTPIPLAKLQAYVTDCNTAFFRQLKEITDLRDDPVRKQMVLDALANETWTEQDLIDMVTDIRDALVLMRDAPKTTFEEIVSACDAVIASVERPPSITRE